MANNFGTIVQSTIRPPSSDDKFPVVFGNEILGGAKQGITLADLNAIPSERLSINTVGVTSENIYVWTGTEWIPLLKQINAQNIFGTGNISTSRDGVEVYVEDYAGDTFEEKLNTAISTVNFGTIINCSNYTGNQTILNTINITKPLTLKFGYITLIKDSTASAGAIANHYLDDHLFNIQSNNVKILGTGRAMNPEADTITDVSDYAALPATGSLSTTYRTLNNGNLYRWDGAGYYLVTIADLPIAPTRFKMTTSSIGGFHIYSKGHGNITLSDFVCEGVRGPLNSVLGVSMTGCGGIHFEKEVAGEVTAYNTVAQLNLDSILIEGSVLHGIFIDTPILGRFSNIRVSKAGAHGIYIYNGTSTSLSNCYVSSAHKAGFCIHNHAYASLIGCAAEYSGVGYWLRNTSATSILSCGSESQRQKGSNMLNSGYSQWNGETEVPVSDVGTDYAGVFRGVGYLITGGKSFNLNAVYSTNITSGSDSTPYEDSAQSRRYACHIRLIGNVQGGSIFNPKFNTSSGINMYGDHEIRIDALAGNYPSDISIDYNPTTSEITPTVDGIHVENVETSGNKSAVLNLGNNIKIAYGKTEYHQINYFDPATNFVIDFNKGSFFNTKDESPLTKSQTYSFVNGKLGDIVRLKLPPISATGNIAFSGTFNILTGAFSSTKFNILYVSVVEYGSYEATINQIDV